MHIYRAYNLCIHSDLRFSELPVGSGAADVVIRRSPIRSVQRKRDQGDCIKGRVPGVLRFVVEDGCRLTVEPAEGADADEVRTIILGAVFSVLLRQRGFLVLHACCIGKGDLVFGFVGDSGWGKSTTAQYFLQDGYHLLNDDVMVIDTRPEQPRAVPGFPQVKLRPEAGAWLMNDYEDLPSLYQRSPKRYSLVPRNFPERSLPLSRLYFLENRSAPSNRVMPLSSKEAFIELIRHTRVTNLIKDPQYLDRHVKQCNAVVSTVPVRRLQRVARLEALPEIKASVERDLGLRRAKSSAAEGRRHIVTG